MSGPQLNPIDKPSDSVSAAQTSGHERKRSQSWSGRVVTPVVIRSTDEQIGPQRQGYISEEKAASEKSTSSSSSAEAVDTAVQGDIAALSEDFATKLSLRPKHKKLVKRDRWRESRAIFNPAAFKGLTPDERAKLDSDLQEFQADPEFVPEKSASLPQLDITLLSPRVLQVMAKEVKVVQEDKRDTHFLNMLEDFDDSSLKKALCFDNESVVPTDHLFAKIQERVVDRLTQIPGNEKKITRLLSFCIGWLQANKGTTVVQKAQNPVALLIAKMENSGHPFINAQRTALQKRLIDAVEIPSSKEERFKSQEEAAGTIDIVELIFGHIATGLIHPDAPSLYESAVQSVASDLRQAQAKLYLAMNVGDFAKKWPTKSGFGAPVDTCLNYASNLFEYVIAEIINRDSLERRQLVGKFFLDVAHRCFMDEDYESAGQLYLVLSNFVFDTLPKTCAEIKKGSFLELDRYYGDHKYEALCEKMASCEKEGRAYIPFLWIPLQRMRNKNEAQPSITRKEGEEPTYNIDKTKELQGIAERYLQAQSRTKEIAKPLHTHTNLVTKHLAKPPISEKLKEIFADRRLETAKSYKEKEQLVVREFVIYLEEDV